ncbi:hypothetical protein K4L44_13830 [Halosquirtibacter laminarini]|uniref:Uncharacterized protein n=1 Tax=Halosquirtibacter laminarini TaxID=3374600 RepID=A0AC61NJT5_9BACT|nr:hypothetical protein K4L44_13830 [Prolixibacteraceae bacterium]
MQEIILEEPSANFYGFEKIDLKGKTKYNPLAIRSNGNVKLSIEQISFTQWLTNEELNIELSSITKVEVKSFHNMKIKWPRKVLRIHFQDGNEIKVMGISLGGKLSFSKGWEDKAYLWKEKIDSILKK